MGGLTAAALLSARGPRTGLPNVWLVGGSVFPGQSTTSVTFGALRVAADVAARAQAASRRSNAKILQTLYKALSQRAPPDKLDA